TSFVLSSEQASGHRFWSSRSTSCVANASLSPRDHATIGHHRRHQPWQSDQPRSNQRIELERAVEVDVPELAKRAAYPSERSERRNRERPRGPKRTPLGVTTCVEVDVPERAKRAAQSRTPTGAQKDPLGGHHVRSKSTYPSE